MRVPTLTVDDSGLFSFPLFLSPGGSYTGVLFTVDVPNATALGPYFGYFQILGGSDANELLAIRSSEAAEKHVVQRPFRIRA